MKKELYKIIKNAKFDGFNYLKVVLMKKESYEIQNNSNVNMKNVESWIYLEGMRNNLRYTLNCTYSPNQSTEFYINLLKGIVSGDNETCIIYHNNNNLKIKPIPNLISNMERLLPNNFSYLNHNYINKYHYFIDTNNLYKKYKDKSIEITGVINNQISSSFCLRYKTNKNQWQEIKRDLLRYNYQEEMKSMYANKIIELNGLIKLSRKVVSDIIRLLIPHFNAEAVLNGTSIFCIKDFISKKDLFPFWLSIYDSNTKNMYSNNFDEEGNYSKKNFLVLDGKLTNCFGNSELMTRYSFIKGGCAYRDSCMTEYFAIRHNNIFLKLNKTSFIKHDACITSIGREAFISPSGDIVCSGFGYTKSGNEKKYGIFNLNMNIFQFFNNSKKTSTNKCYDKINVPEILVDLRRI